MDSHMPQGPLTTREIIYISVVGPIIVGVLVEWFLWLAAFMYCFVKVIQKADHWSQKLLAVALIFVFLILRAVYLPIMLVTLPLPRQVTAVFPTMFVWYLQAVSFYSFAALLIAPWLMSVFQIAVHSVGRKAKLKELLDDSPAPKVAIVMPVYKEPADCLWRAINSVVDCDYPKTCIHVFVSFDGDAVDELYLKTIDRLGVPVTLKNFPQSIDVCYNGVRVTVSRFPHGGKRHCQKYTFFLIDKIYKRYLERKDDLFILFIDSDCILDKVCIQNFMYEMELRPGLKHEMLAMTGIITTCTEKNSLITILQDVEYIHGQLYERTIESGCGAVTCLPGALTILRFSAFKNMSKFYFSDNAEICEDLFDYGKTHLGEDRWLTHLFMLGAKDRFQIQMCTAAFCKTEAVQTWRSLLKQRRRWFIGFITNEVCMLTDPRLWRKYPWLIGYRLLQGSIRSTPLLLLLMITSVSVTAQSFTTLPYQIIAVSLGLNWLMMVYFAFKLKRWKTCLYPLLFVLSPMFSWVVMIYGIFTAGQRTWGGPRADASVADVKVTPQEAVEQAEEAGDDLNVIPETFRPAVQARKRRTRPSTLLPSPNVEGRFATIEQPPADSQENKGKAFAQQADDDLEAMRRSWANDSDASDSEGVSIHTPKPLAHILRESRQDHGLQLQSRRRSSQSSASGRTLGIREDIQEDGRLSSGHSGNRIAGPTDLHADELCRRLSTLPRPAQVHRSGGFMTDMRSPLDLTSPMRALSPSVDDVVAVMGSKNTHLQAQMERGRSKRKKLQKRNPSPVKGI